MSDPIRTWSIVADQMGGHWHCKVRRGIEWSRALLGELTFDLSDAVNFKQQIDYTADRIVVRVVSRVLEELGKDRLLRVEPGPVITELAIKYGEAIVPECRELAIEHLTKQLGVRVDLAKVNG